MNLSDVASLWWSSVTRQKALASLTVLPSLCGFPLKILDRVETTEAEQFDLQTAAVPQRVFRKECDGFRMQVYQGLRLKVEKAHQSRA